MMTIRFNTDGTFTAIYGEEIDLAELSASLTIRRASHVEPTADGKWTADLEPVAGPVLGPFTHRSLAIEAEIEYLGAAIMDGRI